MELRQAMSPYLRSLALLVVAQAVMSSASAGDPVALRVESFTVPPATQPLAFVVIKNLRKVPYEGRVTLRGPSGWRIAPAARSVSLASEKVQRVPFAIEQGTNLESNSYAVQVSASGGG